MSTRKGRKSATSNSDRPSRSKKTPRSDSSDSSMFESEGNDFYATWECTACTFANRFEAFVCEICGTRKGTSTRKPRLNTSVVQQQALAQALALSQDKEKRRQQRNSSRVEKNAGNNGGGSRASSAGSSHKKSPTREVLSPTSSTRGSHDNEESTTLMTMHKKDKIRNSLIYRDAVVEREVRDEKNVAYTIVTFASRHVESELKMIKVLREEDERETKRNTKIAVARERFKKEYEEFMERRKKQREERAKFEQERQNNKMVLPAALSGRGRKTPGRKPKNTGGPSTSTSNSRSNVKPRGRPSTSKPIGRPRNNPVTSNSGPPPKKR